MIKQSIITILIALVAVAAYSQVDSTKMKKKNNPIALRGTVADGFTKAAIRDVTCLGELQL